MNAKADDLVVIVLTRDEADATSRLIAAVAKYGGSAAARIGGIDAAKREIDQAADIARRVGAGMTIDSIVGRALAATDRYLSAQKDRDPFGEVGMRAVILAALGQENPNIGVSTWEQPCVYEDSK